MEYFNENDIITIQQFAGKTVENQDYSELDKIYRKLEQFAQLLRENGFDYSIRKDPRKQAGPGTFKFQDYQWVKIFPSGYRQFCEKKFAYPKSFG